MRASSDQIQSKNQPYCRQHTDELHLQMILNKAHGGINHAAKRGFFNIDMQIQYALDHLEMSVDVTDTLRGIQSVAREALVNCRRLNLELALQGGTYTPEVSQFPLSKLFCNLGLQPRIHIETHMSRCTWFEGDEALLTSMISNAVSNAMSHGATNGEVQVTFSQEEAFLRVVICNEAGPHHSEMLLLQEKNGLNFLLRGGSDISSCGREGSTFRGMGEMTLMARVAGADLDITFLLDKVELTIDYPLVVINPVAVVKETFNPIQPNKVFVIADDDRIVRLVSEKLLTLAHAHEDSVILGATFSEAQGIVDTVKRLADKHGSENVVCLLDQNMDYTASDQSVRGTDICRELVDIHKFTGVLAIRSASDERAQQYYDAGAALVVGKTDLWPSARILHELNECLPKHSTTGHTA